MGFQDRGRALGERTDPEFIEAPIFEFDPDQEELGNGKSLFSIGEDLGVDQFSSAWPHNLRSGAFASVIWATPPHLRAARRALCSSALSFSAIGALLSVLGGRGGLRARKSRWRRGSIDNFGGFQLINDNSWIVAGEKFNMTADDVIAYCSEREA
jgi:hypothetical protein